MATKAKEKVSADEKFANIDFPLFPALDALDRKDYDYYSNLTAEQQKGFAPFMLTHWMSTVQSKNQDIQRYYLQSCDAAANKYILHENITKHPKLQWLMLCAVSPGVGKQFHKYIPHIKQRVSLLQDVAKFKDTKDYFVKIYPKAGEELIDEVSTEFVRDQKRKHYLAKQFPNLKHEDIETLHAVITDADIEKYEKDRGN